MNAFFTKMILMTLAASAMTLESAAARNWVVAAGRPGAADTNAGTEEKPFATIQAAADKAEPGDTVLVYAGIYRERVIPARGGTEKQPVLYQAVPGNTVAVKGSDVWTHWQPVPGKRGVYSAEIAGHIPEGQPNPFRIGISIAPKDLDVAARPTTQTDALPKTLGQVFFNGMSVTEASSESTVMEQENTWVATADGLRVLAHFPGSPESVATHLVEVSVRNRVFAPRVRGLSYIRINGFVFEHAANQGPFPQGGMVSPRSGSFWVLENNTIRFAKTIGLDIGSETWEAGVIKDTEPRQLVRMEGGHHIVRNNHVCDNGLAGISGWHHNGAVICGNIVERNNALGFNHSDAPWEEWGGIKLHGKGAWIEGNLVRDNDAHGIWIDNDYTDSRITRNIVLGNRMSGIFLELGDGRCMVDHNIVALTRPRDEMYGGIGIYAHDAAGLIIAHNLIYGNADCGVLLRTVSDRVFAGKPVHTSNTRILNNILWNNSKPAISLPYPGARAGNNISDYNAVSASRDLWLGFDADPGLFTVNLYKSDVTIDQLVAKVKEALDKGSVPAEDRPNMKTWRRNPTLTLAQWRLVTGQDRHSKEMWKMVSLLLRPLVPMLTYKADAALLDIACPPVEGLNFDFSGKKLTPGSIRPGPFQDIGTAFRERVLFPMAFSEVAQAQKDAAEDDAKAKESASIFWEAESASATSMGSDGPYRPLSPEETRKVSGGQWLNGKIAADSGEFYADYSVDVPKTGRYRLFARRFWQHGAFRWRTDDGEWQTVRKADLLDTVELRQHVPLCWVAAGEAELTAGTHRVRVEIVQDADYEFSKAYGIDCFVLTQGELADFLESRPEAGSRGNP